MSPRCRLHLGLLAVGSFAAISGCGVGTVTHSVSGTLALSGRVHGGQQPVTGAGIQLYAVGTGGNGSLAMPMLKQAVSTQAGGVFNIGGDYTCASDDEQMYIVASRGNPGLADGTDNPALVMVSALGACSNLETPGYFIEINEVTTAAAAWAMSPFIDSAAYVGASSSNPTGIANAMLDAQLLADTGTGLATALPAGLSVETDKLYALADALAPCVNSDGTAGCTNLFAAATPTGGTAPATTLQAALNIVRHPGENVAAVFGALNAEAPFPTGYTAAPNDWTMSLTITGNGLNAPASLGVDAASNVWVADHAGALSAFTAQGTPLAGSPYGAGTLNQSYGLAIDTNNTIWVTSLEQPHHGRTYGSISAFVGSGSVDTGSFLNGTAMFYDSSLDFPVAVAADTNGNLMIANYASSSATIYNDSGGAVSTGLGSGSAAFPLAIAPDASHGVWLANQGDYTVTHVAADGTIISHATCCDGAEGVATDAFGNAWFASYYNSSVSEVSPDANGDVLISGDTNGGVDGGYPVGIAVDAAQNIWVANNYGGTISELAGNGGTLTPGSGISPPTGYGIDAALEQPYGIAPDASGNVWVTSFGSNQATSKLTMFFGLAAPTATPLRPSPVAP